MDPFLQSMLSGGKKEAFRLRWFYSNGTIGVLAVFVR